jgi:hypothetical protein
LDLLSRKIRLRHLNLLNQSTGEMSTIHLYISFDEQMILLPTVFRSNIRTQRCQQCRNLTTSARRDRSRDVMAKYRRPIQTFDTISTIPAASSFQTVPPPTSSKDGIRKAIPIPAMATPDLDMEVKEKKEVEDKDKEMIVQGIIIPPKPVPPKDDGTSPPCFISAIDTNDRMLYEQLRELRLQSLRRRPRSLHLSPRRRPFRCDCCEHTKVTMARSGKEVRWEEGREGRC